MEEQQLQEESDWPLRPVALHVEAIGEFADNVERSDQAMLEIARLSRVVPYLRGESGLNVHPRSPVVHCARQSVLHGDARAGPVSTPFAATIPAGLLRVNEATGEEPDSPVKDGLECNRPRPGIRAFGPHVPLEADAVRCLALTVVGGGPQDDSRRLAP